MPSTSLRDDGPFWLVVSRNSGGDLAPYRDAHLRYMRGLVDQGAIVGSGPIAADAGHDPLGGATVLRAATRADAHAIMQREPYVRNGVRQVEIFAWSIRQGEIA